MMLLGQEEMFRNGKEDLKRMKAKFLTHTRRETFTGRIELQITKTVFVESPNESCFPHLTRTCNNYDPAFFLIYSDK
jgi:hypothetical protein